MTALGKNQLSMLRAVGITAAVVVPSPLTKRLCELGLMKSVDADGSFAHITPNGLRALADAADAGKVDLFVMPKPKPPVKSGDGQ